MHSLQKACTQGSSTGQRSVERHRGQVRALPMLCRFDSIASDSSSWLLPVLVVVVAVAVAVAPSSRSEFPVWPLDALFSITLSSESDSESEFKLYFLNFLRLVTLPRELIGGDVVAYHYNSVTPVFYSDLLVSNLRPLRCPTFENKK